MRQYCLSALLILACAACSKHVEAPQNWRSAVNAHVASGDTAAAIAVLDSVVAVYPRDAAAWNRMGMLAWAKARPEWHGRMVQEREQISMMRRADTALRLAHAYGQDSARYALDLGRFFLFGDLVTLRVQAIGKFEHAIDAARRAGDSTLVSEAADELGMVFWRRYEAVANRRLIPSGINTIPYHALSERKAVKDWIETATQRYPEPSGQLDYLKASDLFTVARAANPAAQLPAKHAFMALAEQGRWEELRATATARIAAAPDHDIAWMALGLAAHRVGDYPRATEAFDRALSLLPPNESARYTGISRILGPSDSVEYEGYSERQRQQFDRTYWTAADPLSLTADNEHRLEFLARIAFAELRWTSEDFELRGADTDRGQIYVRYGPPPEIIAMPPAGSGGNAGASLVLWYYPLTNLHFVFRQPPSYGTATYEFSYHEIAREARFVAPVTWTNVPVTMSIDSVPVQVVRFRGPGDSSDVALFAHLPVRRLLTGLDLTSGTVDVGLTLYRGALEIVERDSMRQTVNVAQPDAAERRTWRRRFAPGELGYRVEALQAEGGRAARALGSVRLTNDRGFGISDVLVADRVEPRADSAARWTDLIIEPNAGVLSQDEDIGVAWETYALTERRGQVRYRVELALTLLEVPRGASLSARVIGGIADLIGISGVGEDRVSLSYEQTRVAAPVMLDYLTLDLADAPAGRYRMTVSVTDLATQQRAETARELRIEP